MSKKKKKSRNQKGKFFKSRGQILLVLILIFGFLMDILHLGNIALIRGDEYRTKAETNRLMDRSLSAVRGTIYDRNMTILAQSAADWIVYVDPSLVPGKDDVAKQEVREEIAIGLSGILEIDKNEILEKLAKSESRYQELTNSATLEQKQQVDAFRAERYRNSDERRGYSLVINTIQDTNRFYPDPTFASNLLGFTARDDVGRQGLEYYYDDVLSGVDGRVVAQQDALSNRLASENGVVYDPTPGTSLVLTIDETVQNTLRNALAQAVESTESSYASGIVMDVNTGAILGMVTMPDYNLEDAYDISPEKIEFFYQERKKKMESSKDEAERAAYAAESEKQKRAQAESDALYDKWSNRAISEAYEPGSVFKCITVAAAMEEGVVNENTPFYCTGSLDFDWATDKFSCIYGIGHGAETLPDLLKNSCNTFAIDVAQKLGEEKYYKYFHAFGFTEQTGIDLPNEFSPTYDVNYESKEDFRIAELSSYSFGQTFTISPIQMITAIAAIGNGGKLMKPYVVEKELDENGNTIKVTEPTVRRQVISESTAKRVSDMMELVVSTGTGKNAYVAGYHVAGKTGTSDKLAESTEDEKKYVASFVGFAPADDPKVAILIQLDEPKGENHGGGAIAAPVAGEVLYNILPYLNIEASYTQKELENIITRCPNAVNSPVDLAYDNLKAEGYTVRIRGEGETVLSQIPDAGSQIPHNGVITLYTESSYQDDKVNVPDFTGLSVTEAYELAADSNLNIQISGVSHSGSSVVAYKQSMVAGQEVTVGTVMTVYFRTQEGVEDFNDT